MYSNTLGGAKYLTVVDIQNAYFAIEIAPEKAPLFSFYNSRRERFCFQRAAQGFHGSAEALERVMRSVLKDLPSCLSYCEDMFIATSNTFEEHLEEVEKLLKLLIKHNLKCKADKIKIAENYVDILGFTWHLQSFSIPKCKLSAIALIPTPNTPKRTKRFLAILKYYERFVYKFSQYIDPLQKLSCCDPKKFKWSRSAEKSFLLLKEKMLNHIPLHAADTSLPFFCSSDSSGTATGFVCYQVVPNKDDTHEKSATTYDERTCRNGATAEDNRKRKTCATKAEKDKLKAEIRSEHFQSEEGSTNDNIRFLGCHSRLYTKVERSYSSFKLECLSLLSGLSSFDYFLRFANKIIVIIDAKSILFLRATKNSTGMNYRIAESDC